MQDSKRFNTEQLCAWVESVYQLPGKQNCLNNIVDNYIDGEAFYYLTPSLLVELGFNRFHAPKILALARATEKHDYNSIVPGSEEIVFDKKTKPIAKPRAAAATNKSTRGLPKNFPQLRCQTPSPIPEVDWSDTKTLMKYFEDQKPCVIKNCGLTANCGEKWTPNYLSRRLKSKVSVFTGNSVYFRYWNTDKNFGKYPFTKPTETVDMTMKEFIENLKRASEEGIKNPDGLKEYFYLQHSLGKGCSELSQDFASWNWPFLFEVIKKNEWVNLTANLLLIGMKDVLTPLHFDEQENIFCQLRGKKEVILFPPSNFDYLYPFPQGHPCDRQSMVNILDADLNQFPRFAEATPLCAVLGPGDALYLPFMYWHQFRNLDDFATSVTFWCIAKPADATELLTTGNISDYSRVAIRRNLEKLTAERVGGWDKLNEALSGVLKETERGVELKKWMLDILAHLQISRKEQEEFLDGIIQGRYGIDHDRWIIPTESQL